MRISDWSSDVCSSDLAVGAHYTYSNVPYDDWWRALTGHSLNEALGWKRNQFDRLVHFSYGLLFAYPIREIFLRVVEVRGFWGYLLPLDVALSTSALYELIEWGAAAPFGGELGAAYLGMQGDIWDAQKDMALAATGARSEERRVGKECVRTCRSRWSP